MHNQLNLSKPTTLSLSSDLSATTSRIFSNSVRAILIPGFFIRGSQHLFHFCLLF